MVFLGMDTEDKIIALIDEITAELRGHSYRTGNTCYDGRNTEKSAGLPLCSIRIKGYGITHFTELHRTPT